jgi:hypothetical protein
VDLAAMPRTAILTGSYRFFNLLTGPQLLEQVSVSNVVQKIKGKSSYKLQRESGLLRKRYWGQRVWARGYFVCSA